MLTILDAADFRFELSDLPSPLPSISELGRLVAHANFDSESHRSICVERALKRAVEIVTRGSSPNVVVMCSGSIVAGVRFNLQAETDSPVETLRFAEPATIG